MNSLNNNTRGSFIRIQTLVGDIITSDRKRWFLIWVYALNVNDSKKAVLDACLGRKNLEFNLMLGCAYRHPNPSLEEDTQEVSRFINQNHIATSTMQSSILPHGIVSKMIDTVHCHHQIRTPTSMYTCTRAIIKTSQRNIPQFSVWSSHNHPEHEHHHTCQYHGTSPSKQQATTPSPPASINTIKSLQWNSIILNRSPRA